MVPEECTKCIRMIYSEATSHVQAVAGHSKMFCIHVEFIKVRCSSLALHSVKHSNRKPQKTSYIHPSADDVVLMAEAKKELEKRCGGGRTN
ncbi:unnamed protein product [Strongylus vulgaris]|uniref:Uncharacterized protein n=1 Tax=Strongylus vulgaris TaxID=40348 RepID=A0A3P7IPW2_STRVU|nr:unnamed protein product [Strongylus vulgaris]